MILIIERLKIKNNFFNIGVNFMWNSLNFNYFKFYISRFYIGECFMFKKKKKKGLSKFIVLRSFI